MYEEDEAYPVKAKKELFAALYEMKFWLRIMKEHAGLIRNGLDPTQKRLFREADQFFIEIEAVQARAVAFSDQSPREQIEELVEETLPLVSKLRDFKGEVAVLISDCKVLTLLPADLLDHIRREADFFLGTLHFARGEVTPSKAAIGIPDGQEPALTVPRRMIPYLPEQQYDIALQETMFWVRQQVEHAEVLVLYLRPEVQNRLLRAIKTHGSRLRGVYQEALEVNKRRRGLDRLLVHAAKAVQEWEIFLRQLFAALVHCKVPTGQINLFPTVVDHMAREAAYYLEVVQIVQKGHAGHGH